MPMTKFLIAFAGAVGLALMPGPGTAAESIAVSAGTKGGPYYRFGHTVCRLVNRKAEDLRCSVMPMPAGDAAESLANIVNLRDGAVEIGFARSDWLHFAFEGTGPLQFLHSKFDTIRSLFSIHAIPFTLLARRDSAIGGLDELEGRRVNLGRPHTEGRKIMDLVMTAKGWAKKDFALAEELKIDDQSLAFCHDWVEAIFYLVSHPNNAVRRVTELCNASIIDVSGPAVDELVAETPYLTLTTVPGGVYESVPEPVPTFGTTIAVVSSSEVSEEIVYSIVKAVFDNLEELRQIHPGLHYLDPATMANDRLPAPLHEGARRYFREQGWL